MGLGRRAGILFTVAALVSVGCSSTETVEFEMTWKYDQPNETWPGTRHVVLSFAEFPKHIVGIHSKDLGDYLDSLEGDTVPVTFHLYRRFGCPAGVHEVKIGDLEHWNAEWSYSGVIGDGLPSPWDRWKCWYEWQ